MTWSKKELKELSQSSRRYLQPETGSIPARCQPVHPQLRELLIAPINDKAALVSGKSLYGLDFDSFSKPTRLLDFPFAPTCLSHGCGLIAAGGQATELAVRSIDGPLMSSLGEITGWSTANYSIGQSINNSVHISKQPGLSVSASREGQARLYASNNDLTLSVWDVDPPLASTSAMQWSGTGFLDTEQEASKFQVVLRKKKVLPMRTPVNHASVSPNGKLLVAVGDTPEVFFFSVPQLPDDDYHLLHTTIAATDASFSTDWSRDSSQCAVASQDGTVNVFDVRSLGRSTNASERAVDVVATFESAPSPIGQYASRMSYLVPPLNRNAVRSVKFSPGHTSELMAFSEQAGNVHVVDARTFDPSTVQIIPVPSHCLNTPSPLDASSALSSLNASDASQDLLRITSRDWQQPSTLIARLREARAAGSLSNRQLLSWAETLPYASNAPNNANPQRVLGESRTRTLSRTTSNASSSVSAGIVVEPRPPTLPRRSANEALLLAEPNSGIIPPAFHRLSDYFDSPRIGRLKRQTINDDLSPSYLSALTASINNRSAGAIESEVSQLQLPATRPGTYGGGIELCGIAWNPAGDVLYASTELGTFAYPVDMLSRTSFPIATIL